MRKLRSIEGARGFAAVAVLCYHAGGWAGGGYDTHTRRLWLGVPLFFVISGFLLYRPFARAAIDHMPRPSLRRYTRARLLRIVPAYWLALTVTVLFLGSGGTGVQLATNYLLVQVAAGQVSLVAPAWSLCAEVAFYLCLPLIAAAAARFARNAVTRNERAFRLAVPLCFAFPIATLYSTAVGNHLTLGNTYPALLPGYIDEFALGMLLAIATTWRPTVSARASRLTFATAVAITLGANVLFWPVYRPYVEWDGWMLSRMMAVAFVLALYSVVSRDEATVLGRVLSARPVVALGTVSYGIYLWHFPIITRLVPTRLWWSGPTDLLLVFALSAGAATVSWLFVERPLLRLKDRTRQESWLPATSSS